MPSLTVIVLGVVMAVAVVAGSAMIVTRRARYIGGQELRGREAVIAGVIVLAGAAWIGWLMTLALHSSK